jgi:hypothetical protein
LRRGRLDGAGGDAQERVLRVRQALEHGVAVHGVLSAIAVAVVVRRRFGAALLYAMAVQARTNAATLAERMRQLMVVPEVAAMA